MSQDMDALRVDMRTVLRNQKVTGIDRGVPFFLSFFLSLLMRTLSIFVWGGGGGGGARCWWLGWHHLLSCLAMFMFMFMFVV